MTRPPLAVRTIPDLPDASQPEALKATALAAQATIFVLTLLLGGMMLSNLVEEKTGKIMEILAASVPIDAIFLGKLFAMLGIALIAIAVWSAFGAAVPLMLGTGLPEFAAPATGWPLFLLFATAYFTTAYLLVGALLLGIGSLAATVREVQTLSMPVTLVELLLFLFASHAVNSPGRAIKFAAEFFPFSSPFAMVARAAQQPALMPHVLALGWQLAWVLITIRVASALFRRNVLKSGGRSARA